MLVPELKLKNNNQPAGGIWTPPCASGCEGRSQREHSAAPAMGRDKAATINRPQQKQKWQKRQHSKNQLDATKKLQQSTFGDF